ncbi:hypothetical protein MYAM1_001204 [Malassezia yamatoensis]|uniref:Major facilitator superfamily (MFS) profile domain-containing protein n=1 Tax=Malassezia yamatoensis TaxID=253288 RepID=A0AAJ5YRD3_9BASI|nr:hypothetical protein MYAM1_001204 [Malassezia yamatoensis]
MTVANERTPLLGQSRVSGAAAQGVSASSAFETSLRDETPAANKDAPAQPFFVVITTCMALWCITLIVSLDTTVVAMLLGNISSAFHSSEKAAWIGSSYLLTACCTAPVYGRLCDIIGGKKALVIALSFFTVGTLGCGAARNMFEFLAARTIAGMGGGGLNTVGSVIVSHLVPLHSRGVYQGLTNIVYGLGISIGGPVGGIFNDTLGWRAVFYCQMPIIVMAFIALLTLLDNNGGYDKKDTRSIWLRIQDIDFLGLGIVTLALFAVLHASDLISVKDIPVSNYQVVLSGVTASIALIAFYVVERYAARVPLISMDVLALRSGWSSLWVNFWQSIATYGYNFYFPLFFQVVGRLPPSLIGERMIPASFALSAGSLFSGFYMRKTGYFYWYTMVCLLFTVVSSGRAVFYDQNPPLVSPFAYNVFLSFSQAGALTTTLISLINCVDKHAIGVATGMSYFFRSNGQVLGVALTGGILQVALLKALRNRIVGPEAEQLIAQIRHEATAILDLPAEYQKAAIASYADALHWVFVFVCACNLMGLLNGLFIENKRLPMPTVHSGEYDEERANVSHLSFN